MLLLVGERARAERTGVGLAAVAGDVLPELVTAAEQLALVTALLVRLLLLLARHAHTHLLARLLPLPTHIT